jgi:uncharacterized protein YndB with AHSA1/START domain
VINKGYFVIADITGYTAFLTGSELDHAQDILKSLFETLHDQIKAPLMISNYQGDAILTYAPEMGVLQGQTLLEIIENVYFAFSRKRENIRNNTTCTCRACANIPNLDLKLFAHYGEYLIQDMRGKPELSGPDVIVAHRMMKNQVKEKTGVKAYSLFTDAAIQKLGLAGMCVEMAAHSETYEHIGEVPMWVYDLKAAWERERERNPIRVELKDAWFRGEADFPLPPALVWDYLNKPEYRAQWMHAHAFYPTSLQKGRVGAGTVNHCAHGEEGETLLTVLDWHPFEYLTEDASFPMHMHAMNTTYLQPTASGTHVIWVFGPPQGRDLFGTIMTKLADAKSKAMLGQIFSAAGATINQLIEKDGIGKTISFAAQATTPTTA